MPFLALLPLYPFLIRWFRYSVSQALVLVLALALVLALVLALALVLVLALVLLFGLGLAQGCYAGRLGFGPFAIFALIIYQRQATYQKHRG